MSGYLFISRLVTRVVGLSGSVPDANEADIFNKPQSVRLKETRRRLAGTVLQARRQVHRLPAGEPSLHSQNSLCY